MYTGTPPFMSSLTPSFRICSQHSFIWWTLGRLQKNPLHIPWVFGLSLQEQPPVTRNPLRNILLTGTVCSEWTLHCHTEHVWSVYSTAIKNIFPIESKLCQCCCLQGLKNHCSAANNMALHSTHKATHPLKHTSRNRKLLSKWHTGRAVLCFTGCCAPESLHSLVSRLDASVERWIFQEKAATKSDRSSLWGGK